MLWENHIYLSDAVVEGWDGGFVILWTVSAKDLDTACIYIFIVCKLMKLIGPICKYTP